MSDVSFEEAEFTTARPQIAKKARPGLAELIQKWGFAKDTAGAEMVMAIILVVALLATVLIYFAFLTPHRAAALPLINPPAAPSSL